MLEKEKQTEYHDVFLTDIQMHVVEPRKPTPWYRAILKSVRNKKPGRFFTKNITRNKDGTFTVTFSTPPELKRQIEGAEKSGKKIRLFIPKDGLLIYPSKDVIEKLKAERKKHRPLTRIWRSDNVK